jgi:hypothetical protein
MSYPDGLNWSDRAAINELSALVNWGDEYTATLLNGWTGTLKFRKNGLGEVWIYGNLTVGTGTFQTKISALPDGYFSTIHYGYIQSYNTATGNNAPFILETDGDIVLGVSTTTGDTISINGVFRA